MQLNSSGCEYDSQGGQGQPSGDYLNRSVMTLDKQLQSCGNDLNQRVKELYMAELRTQTKRRNEDWPVYGESLEKLADKAYPELQEEARGRFALNQYLTQLTNPQVAFGVKQSKPKTIDDAVRLTLEMETYLQPEKPEGISFVERSDDNYDLETIAVTTSSPHENPLKELLRRLDGIEAELKTLKQPNTSQMATLTSVAWLTATRVSLFPAVVLSLEKGSSGICDH